MELIRRLHLMREISQEARGRGRKIGLVPTMGALHDGHLSLVRRARELCDLVVVSVFVNPAQFGPNEDFDRYPRDLTRDADLCVQEGVDYLFAPSGEEMYPPGYRTWVEVEGLSDVFEGASRPGHFRGVATVVLKLFNIVRPHFSFFGQKDGQQVVIVQRMIRDLNLDVELVVCPTQRDADGLALSSRNAYLDPDERAAATCLYRALERARELIEDQGVRDARQVEAAMRQVIESEPLARLDYLAITDTETLERVDEIDRRVLVALAVWIGETRLIDNMILEPRKRGAHATMEEARP
ncbi:MAG: pantoate--beta-alanine ligase [Acidobacteria bacterium]|nr:MAG: pantoate--beta-alanine ligase [Acidobacteriota bacterium]